MLAKPGPAAGAPRVDLAYWLAMLTAGTLGAAIGHGLDSQIGLPGAGVLGLAVVATVLGARARIPVAATYRVAIVAIRTLGTNVGDLAGDALGLLASTALTGMLIAA